MKKLLCIAGMILMLPLLSYADSELIFTDTGGVLTGDSHGYVLMGGILTGVSGGGFGSLSGTDLGTVTFTTGILGSVSNVRVGGDILPGGSMVITSNGSDGLPAGILFTGNFQGGFWTPTIDLAGNYLYTMTEGVTSASGQYVGMFTLTLDTGQRQYYGYSIPGYDVASFIPNGTTTIAVPEPGELGLLGAGLVGLAGSIGRKRSRGALRNLLSVPLLQCIPANLKTNPS